VTKMKNTKIIDGDGDLCPRCKQPTQIREHVQITPKILSQPFYYKRWFVCCDPTCQTNQIMPDRYIVPRNQDERNKRRWGNA
jgi:hypothetical protein